MKIILAALILLGPPRPRVFYCHMVTDGSVYCYAPDGHIFRPRVNDFLMYVQ